MYSIMVWMYYTLLLYLLQRAMSFYSYPYIHVQISSDEMKTNKKIGFFSGIKEVFSFKPYVLLLMLELFSWLAIQVGTSVW